MPSWSQLFKKTQLVTSRTSLEKLCGTTACSLSVQSFPSSVSELPRFTPQPLAPMAFWVVLLDPFWWSHPQGPVRPGMGTKVAVGKAL